MLVLPEFEQECFLFSFPSVLTLTFSLLSKCWQAPEKLPSAHNGNKRVFKGSGCPQPLVSSSSFVLYNDVKVYGFSILG